MAVGWYISRWNRDHDRTKRIRYPAVLDAIVLIDADGGAVGWIEVRGGACIAKVRASVPTLTTIAGLAGVQHLPLQRLDDALGSLSPAERDRVQAIVMALGWTRKEIAGALPGSLADHTLRDVLELVRGRRQEVRYDETTDELIDDGPDLPPFPLSDVDRAVSDG